MDRQRVLFALWPDDPVRDAIAARAARLSCKGRRVPREHLHMTLVFAGSIPAARAQALLTAAAGLDPQPAFDLSLDRAGGFRSARVQWLGPSQIPPELRELAETLQALCRSLRIRLPAAPFHPHVTVYRNVAEPRGEPVGPIRWRVRGFVLIESGSDGKPGAYRMLHRWTLASR